MSRFTDGDSISHFNIISLHSKHIQHNSRDEYLVECNFCQEKQIKSYHNLWQAFSKRVSMMKCDNKVCNYYRRNFYPKIDYEDYILLVGVGCIICGGEILRVGQICKICQDNISMLGKIEFFNYITKIVLLNIDQFDELAETFKEDDIHNAYLKKKDKLSELLNMLFERELDNVR